MNKLLLALCALIAGALLIPDMAEAQRGGRGGGGGRIGGGGFGVAGFGGGGGFRGGGLAEARECSSHGEGWAAASRGGAIAARPGRGDFRMAAIGRPGYGVRAHVWPRRRRLSTLLSRLRTLSVLPQLSILRWRAGGRSRIRRSELSLVRLRVQLSVLQQQLRITSPTARSAIGSAAGLSV